MMQVIEEILKEPLHGGSSWNTCCSCVCVGASKVAVRQTAESLWAWFVWLRSAAWKWTQDPLIPQTNESMSILSLYKAVLSCYYAEIDHIKQQMHAKYSTVISRQSTLVCNASVAGAVMNGKGILLHCLKEVGKPFSDAFLCTVLLIPLQVPFPITPDITACRKTKYCIGVCSVQLQRKYIAKTLLCSWHFG